MTSTEWVAVARKRQGLPSTIEDQTVLARLAVLIRRTGGTHTYV